MTLLEWSAPLSVGITELDLQHQELIGYINKLHESILQGNGIDSLPGVFDNLARYAETHFSTEERFFEHFRFPGAEEHINKHRMFIADLLTFKERYEAGEKDIALPMLKFLSDWLLNHMNDEDLVYAAYFKKNGLI